MCGGRVRPGAASARRDDAEFGCAGGVGESIVVGDDSSQVLAET